MSFRVRTVHGGMRGTRMIALCSSAIFPVTVTPRPSPIDDCCLQGETGPWGDTRYLISPASQTKPNSMNRLKDELDQLLWSDPGAATARDARANAAGKGPPATGTARHGLRARARLGRERYRQRLNPRRTARIGMIRYRASTDSHPVFLTLLPACPAENVIDPYVVTRVHNFNGIWLELRLV